MEKEQKSTANPKSDSKSKGKTNMDSKDSQSAKGSRENTKKNDTVNAGDKKKTATAKH